MQLLLMSVQAKHNDGLAIVLEYPVAHTAQVLPAKPIVHKVHVLTLLHLRQLILIPVHKAQVNGLAKDE